MKTKKDKPTSIRLLRIVFITAVISSFIFGFLVGQYFMFWQGTMAVAYVFDTFTGKVVIDINETGLSNEISKLMNAWTEEMNEPYG